MIHDAATPAEPRRHPQPPDMEGYALPPDPARLGEIDLFHGLSESELAALQPLLRRRTFPAGAMIMDAEQPGDVLYVIVDGAVKVHLDQADGSEVILAILGPGEVVGEMSVVDSLGRSASVVTMDESTLYWMDRAAFWTCMRTMPTMVVNLATIMARRLRLANERIQALSTLDVYGRVARYLLALGREYGEQTPEGDTRIPVRLTQSNLASLVGASRVRVNQVLQTYKRRHWISVDARLRTTIHAPEALAERCQ